jgi:two-component system sensor histidine kinase BaeS
MKSLRAQLILSHVLPQLLILPLLVMSLGYIIESQILLADLASNFRSVAMLVAQDAAARPAIWQDSSQADGFARLLSDNQNREIILLRPDGEIQAAPLGDAGLIARLSPNDLAALRAGETLVKSSYNLSLDGMHVEAMAPVVDSRQVVVGIVRITDRIGNVYNNFRLIRNIEIAATLLSLLAAVGLGIWLARRFELRLQAIMGAVEGVANANDAAVVQSFGQEQLPPEFRRVFAAVNTLSTRLRASEEARKRLLANLVHEVARPLGALQSAVHALQRGAVEDPTLRQNFLQGMDDQIERLKPLLENLASLYVLSGQPVELHPEQVDLGNWLREILVTWQVAAQASGLRWQCELPDDLPVVSLDPGRMAQVIGNLIANAIKYTPDGGCIRVAAGGETRQVWISVEDTGIGITPEERQRIFESLYRGPRARRFPQGMGLGLSIAVEIVRLHGGDLQVSSEVDRGSRFTVYLPVEIPGPFLDRNDLQP